MFEDHPRALNVLPRTSSSEVVAVTKTAHFIIRPHKDVRIIEVVYPSHPTLDSYLDYERDVRDVILAMRGQWDCLVDQRSLKVAPPEISGRIGELNAWARENGMRRTARVVADSAVSELQARRITREAQLAEEAKLFHTREDAWSYLTGSETRRSP